MPVVLTKDQSADIVRRVRELTRKQVLVGIPAADNTRTDGPIGNAAIGYVMEYGSPDQNIPARPFLIPGVQAALPQATERLRRAGEAALRGGDPVPQMTAAGLIAENAVKEGIRDVIPPPLAPLTLARRKARGFTGTTPLIDTNQLLQSITSVIDEK